MTSFNTKCIKIINLKKFLALSGIAYFSIKFGKTKLRIICKHQTKLVYRTDQQN